MSARSSATTSARAHRRSGALALASRLHARAQWRRRFAKPAQAIAAIAIVAALALTAIVAAWPRARAPTAALILLLNAHPFSAASFTALIAFVGMQRYRRQAERDYADSWLAAAPLQRDEVTAFLRSRAVAASMGACAALIVLVAVLGAASGAAVRSTCSLLGSGVVLGAVAGWRSGAHAHADHSPTLPRLRKRRHGSASAASFDALRRWPFAQMLATVDPRQHARIVAAMLLGMPMGVPLSVAALVLLLLATGIGASTLLQALLATIPRAADSLRCTPLSTARWAALLCAPVFACEAAAAVLAALLIRALGTSTAAALVCAAAWLLWVALATLCAFAARHHRSAHLRGTLAGLAMVLLALATIAPLLLLIAVPAIAGWQWHRAQQA